MIELVGGFVAASSGADDDINLSKSWGTIWNAVQNSVGTKLTNFVAIIGCAIVLMALVKWAWDRRRGGGGQGASAIWGALLIGAILSAPGVLLPLMLTIVDAIANAVLSVWRSTK